MYQGIAAANTLVDPGFAQRTDSTGVSYVRGEFNEVTGAPITDGLVLYLDAMVPASYPGTGASWSDLVSGAVFTINPLAYRSDGPQYMDFNGSYGCAKKIDSDFAISGNVTAIVWTRVKNNATAWRTLFRGLSSGNDHQVIIQYGAWNIGMYDGTNATGFNDSTFSQQNLPGYGTTQWVMMTWRWNNAATPYYNFSYNDSPGTIRGSNSSINARFKHGFCSIGGYNNGVQTDPNNASQYWGDISSICMYNRYLSDAEIIQNFNAQRGRFGI
jgi:hypothetical protein